MYSRWCSSMYQVSSSRRVLRAIRLLLLWMKIGLGFFSAEATVDPKNCIFQVIIRGGFSLEITTE
jgi:hypothetical protein